MQLAHQTVQLGCRAVFERFVFRSAADASVADRSDAPDYGNDDFESYTERTAAARGESERDASSKRSTPRSVATKTQIKPVQRQTSFGAESDTSLNRSG
jgi:hypothetical protein